MGVDWNKPLRRKGDKVKVEAFHMIPDEFLNNVSGSNAVCVKFCGEDWVRFFSREGTYLNISPHENDLENYEPDIEVWVNVFRRPDGSLYTIAAPDAEESENQRLTKPMRYVFVGSTKTTVSVE